MKNELCLVVSAEGKATFIYDDEHAEFIQELGGTTKIERVSHVEPFGIQWIADLSPIKGPVLGPFDLRQQALDAEVAYLENKMFGDADAEAKY